MESGVFNAFKQVIKHWWVSLLIGILSIILGIWCAAAPESTLTILSALFTAGFFASGIMEIIFAIANKKAIQGWGWTLASGIINLLFGVILIIMPMESIFVLILFVGFWLMFQSVWGIGASIELKHYNIRGWESALTLAIIGLIFSFILIIKPAFAANVIVWLLAIALIIYGILRIYYAYRLKSISNHLDEVKREIENN